MPYTPVPVGNQFIRNFPVPLDRDFVFLTTDARNNYLTNSSTSGIAYTGMIVADLQTNKAYLLDSNRTWVEVGASAANSLFTGSGMLFRTGSTQDTFKVGGLSSGNNIVISNPSGLSNGNPTIGLSSSLTGLSSVSALNSNSLISGFQINASTGTFDTVNAQSLTAKNITIDNGGDLNYSGVFKMGTLFMEASYNVGITSLRRNAYISALSGTTFIDSSGINLTALDIDGNAGPINISGSSINISGQTNFNILPTVNGTGVSLSGHKHGYADVTDFCDGVAGCVNTSLLSSNGVNLSYDNGINTLTVQLTGQASGIHNFNGTGFISKTGTGPADFAGRTISTSGTNIWIGNGNGANGNPSIGLNPDVNVTTLNTSQGVTVGTDLVINGNLTVNGDTIITNVETVSVEDPSLRLGGTTGVLSAGDFKDRGIEFVYQTGNSVAITGFYGYDQSTDSFVFLKNATNLSGIYSGSSGLLNVGGLFSAGGVSGSVLTSTVANGTAPLAVTSTTAVTNLNADYLDGQHGDYYRNSANLSGTINIGVLPVASTSASGIALFQTDNFIFNTAGIVSTRNTVYTSGTQRVSGIKSFANNTILESGVTVSGTTAIVAATSTNTTTYFPVFSGSDPNSSAQTIFSRTLQNVRSDLGTNSNTTGTLVLRDSTNGGFTAGTITATGFVGDGGSITGIDASNISKGTLGSGLLPSLIATFTTTASSPVSGYNFINGLTVDRAGRLLSATSGRLPIATVNDIGLARFSSTNFSVDANGTVSIANDGITLGTHTTGQYTKSVGVSGSGLSITDDGLEGLGYTITSNASSSSITGTIVVRDAAGNFAANLVNLSGISGSISASSPAGGTTPTYTSTSISGVNNSTYLMNFVIDGGTP